MSRFALICLALSAAAFAVSAPERVDLTRALIVTGAALTSPEAAAVNLLRDEVESRTGIRWDVVTTRPAGAAPAIVIGRVGAAGSAAPESRPEGFRNGVVRSPALTVTVAGRDSRGVLFGVGHLLRKMEMRRGQVLLDANYAVATAPETRLRGHQLGYRPKTNSYDGWSLAVWEQYIRDLAVFGTNAIELIPPRSDDDADSPHFPAPPMETMIGMSKLAAGYGLDVWIWYPALDKDYADPKTVEFALGEWGEVFRKLPRVDAVFVPAGDPGHTPLKILFPLLEKQAANLRRYHPKAQLWLAPQGWDAANIEDFFAVMAARPAWMSGIVFGPQVRIPLAELRRRLPKEYPIRHYPDITHTRSCQYPVPDWDAAFAFPLGRETINPRPVDQAAVFRLLQKHTVGFITYSEGANDDVNKMIWSGLGWNAQTPVMEILRDYGRYFISPGHADDFAQGLLALERNWRGPAVTNGGIRATLQQFQAMEKTATPRMRLNWRFQQALYRAYYDAYTQSRALYEDGLEQRAMERLRAAPETGSLAAMEAAEAVLEQAHAQRVAADLRARVFELAEALFQSLRMQLSVPRYQAIAVGRGANLDTIDVPLNSREWLLEQFARIRKLADEPKRLAAIDALVNWTNPGPGGFHDDLGNTRQQPHLVPGPGFAEDPQYFRGPLMYFDNRRTGPKSWWDHAMTLYEQPLRMKYDGLDPAARYRVRVVYGAGPLRLRANGKHEIHGYLERPYEVLEYAVPPEATRGGELTLEWNRTPGGGGAGRGCQVAEVWLIKERAAH